MLHARVTGPRMSGCEGAREEVLGVEMLPHANCLATTGFIPLLDS